VHILSEIPNQIMLFWTTFLKTFLSFFKNYILHFIRNSKFICSRKYRAFSLFLSFSYCGVYIRSFWDMSKLKKFPLNKKNAILFSVLQFTRVRKIVETRKSRVIRKRQFNGRKNNKLRIQCYQILIRQKLMIFGVFGQ